MSSLIFILSIMQPVKEIIKKKPQISAGVKLFTRSKFNIPHLICEHIIGKEQKIQHRLTVGTGFMVLGVIITKCYPGLFILHWFFEVLGSSFHGIGLIPWIEYITQNVEAKNEAFKRNQLDLKPLEEVEETLKSES